MAFSQTDKEQVVEALIAAQRQAQLAELSLRSQGETQEADRIRTSTKALSAMIDSLIGAMMQEWVGQAGPVTGDLKARTRDLEKAVDEIRRRVQIAQTVVRAIGLIDQAVASAAKVFAS